jgi:hypothetical protein
VNGYFYLLKSTGVNLSPAQEKSPGESRILRRCSMPRFAYEITKHPAEEFDQLVYFCTDQGECGVRELPPDQLSALGEIMNQRGAQGWELIQVLFGKDGVVIFWKRSL